MTSLSTDREKGFNSFLFFSLSLSSIGVLGLFAFVLTCFVFICYKKVQTKKWTSFSRLCLVEKWCLEYDPDPHPPKSALLSVQFHLFLFVFFSPFDIRRLLWTPVAGHRERAALANVMWKTLRCCQSHRCESLRYKNTLSDFCPVAALVTVYDVTAGVDVQLFVLYIWVMYRTQSTNGWSLKTYKCMETVDVIRTHRQSFPLIVTASQVFHTFPNIHQHAYTHAHTLILEHILPLLS